MATEEIELQIMHTTQDGVLVSNGHVEVWLPIDEIENWDRDWGPGDTVLMDVPVWLANDRGLL